MTLHAPYLMLSLIVLSLFLPLDATRDTLLMRFCSLSALYLEFYVNTPLLPSLDLCLLPLPLSAILLSLYR